jgi:hypothetical protein
MRSGGAGVSGRTPGGGGAPGSSGSSGSGNTAGSGGSSGSGAACGSRGLDRCPAGQFCNHPPSANCGAADAPGQCMQSPMICPTIYSPVCGCDGQTYGNSCEAAGAGVSVQHEGECGSSSNGGVDCDTRDVGCEIATPECPEGQVPSQAGICYGPCVAIEECACRGPDDCPDRDRYTCHLSAGHCGPYV